MPVSLRVPGDNGAGPNATYRTPPCWIPPHSHTQSRRIATVCVAAALWPHGRSEHGRRRVWRHAAPHRATRRVAMRPGPRLRIDGWRMLARSGARSRALVVMTDSGARAWQHAREPSFAPVGSKGRVGRPARCPLDAHQPDPSPPAGARTSTGEGPIAAGYRASRAEYARSFRPDVVTGSRRITNRP